MSDSRVKFQGFTFPSIPRTSRGMNGSEKRISDAERYQAKARPEIDSVLHLDSAFNCSLMSLETTALGGSRERVIQADVISLPH